MEALLAKVGFRIAIGILALAGVVLIPVAAAQHIQIHGWPFVGGGLAEQVDGLQEAINDPNGGYVVELERARQGGKVCEAALARQSQAVTSWKAAADRNAALAAAALAGAKSQGAKLRELAAAILASPTTGDACKSAFNRNRENAR